MKIEKIREGVAEQIFWTTYLFNPVQGADWNNIRESDRDGFLKRADRILQFLADEGMGWAEEVEMPDCVKWATMDNIEVRGAGSIYRVAQQDILSKVGKLIKFKSLKEVMPK